MFASLFAAALSLAPAAPPPPRPVGVLAPTQPKIRRPPPRPGERTWLPAAFSLSNDPGFTPWSAFLSLKDGKLVRWTLEGTSLGGGLRCGSMQDGGCQPLAFAMLALGLHPAGSAFGFFVAPSMSSVNVGGRMQTAPGISAGITFTPASLASIVRRRRGRDD